MLIKLVVKIFVLMWVVGVSSCGPASQPVLLIYGRVSLFFVLFRPDLRQTLDPPPSPHFRSDCDDDWVGVEDAIASPERLGRYDAGLVIGVTAT